VGMLPGGSACDSHKTHGIPKDFQRAFEIIAEGYHERFPVGKLVGDTERYFIEMINGAFIGETSAALYDRFEWAHGELGYAYAAIRIAMGYKPIPTKITIDNEIVREVNLSTFAVAITDCISDFQMIPGNHPRKGDFAILMCKDITGLGLVRLILQAINGKHVKNKKVEILRGKHVLIESEKPHIWESEGEIPSRNATRIETTYIPDAVNLIIPKGWQYGISQKERNKLKKKVLKKQPPFDS
jgi:diacylglycerol kinase (ATP)